ncbi:small ribosomal subunit protein mS31 [Prorops nasuta]|uniref:small ribosomal subunit protein mS31 n=1 Tax=Prorops nasuta TaxID=863751 RepID=UPI0034CFD37A
MLASNILKKYMKSFVISNYQFHLSVRLHEVSDSSSDSSDSSDSDSDSENNVKKQTQNTSMAKPIQDLNVQQILSDMLKKTNDSSRQIDVAVNPKKDTIIGKLLASKKHSSYQEKLTLAAKNVAAHMGRDEKQTVSTLVEKALPKSILRDLVQESKNKSNLNVGKKGMSWSERMIKERQPGSVSKMLLSEKTFSLYEGTTFGIFKHHEKSSLNVSDLETWQKLQKKELILNSLYAPENIFQEMIKWTEEGKLWHFPIDNEQGLEEEKNIHFSEHVFLERYLKDWCPNKGPIRHFMELVCVGLSKNPYYTVDEKVNHIMWYKEYFCEKEEILEQLGVIDSPMKNSIKQIES